VVARLKITMAIASSFKTLGGKMGNTSNAWLTQPLEKAATKAYRPPNPSFNRTCFGVAAPGVISFSPGFATLAHAG
jgi:hypothetical protein